LCVRLFLVYFSLFAILLLQLEKKTKQLDEQVLKADKEYFDSCKKLELARAEWDSSVYKVQFAAVVLFSISL